MLVISYSCTEDFAHRGASDGDEWRSHCYDSGGMLGPRDDLYIVNGKHSTDGNVSGVGPDGLSMRPRPRLTDAPNSFMRSLGSRQ